MPEYQITSVVTRLRNMVVAQWLHNFLQKKIIFQRAQGEPPRGSYSSWNPSQNTPQLSMLRTTCQAKHHARKPVAYVLDASRHRERWRDKEEHKREGHLPIPRLLDPAHTPGNRQPLPPPHFRLPLPLFPSAGNTNLLQMGSQVVAEARHTRRARRGGQWRERKEG